VLNVLKLYTFLKSIDVILLQLSILILAGVNAVGFMIVTDVGVPTSYLVILGFYGSVILTVVPLASTCVSSVQADKSTVPVSPIQFCIDNVRKLGILSNKNWRLSSPIIPDAVF